MATFTVDSFKTTLRTELTGRAGLSGVGVWTADPGRERLEREAIVLGDWRHTDAYLSMGPKTIETYVVSGRVFVHKPGGDETAIQTTRARAVAIVNEVKDELVEDPTVTGVVGKATFSAATGREGVLDTTARWCEIEFEIEVEARDV